MPTFASGTKYYIPITLTNSQSTPTSANLPVMITINSNSFTAYEASDISNINWQDGAGNILNSWLESGETNTSTSTVYWVNLKTNTIAASGGTLTIYLCFYSTTTNNFNSAGPTGAEPNHTATYGQYDNGATVFSFYDNFAGTSLSSKWSESTGGNGTVTINNGLTLSCSGPTQTTIQTVNTQVGTNDIVEARSEVTTMTSSSNLGLGIVDTNKSSTTNGYFNFFFDNAGSYSYNSYYRESSTWVLQDSAYLAFSLSTYYIVGSYRNGSTLRPIVNYTLYTSGSGTIASTGSLYIIAPRLWAESTSDVGTVIITWIRDRISAPNGVMPTVSSGPLQPTPISIANDSSAHSPLYYLPITLANSQSTNTGTNFQCSVTINSSTYSTYEASNLSNINFQDGAGNILTSWLESGETNSSTSTIYWIKLPNGIGANSSLDIYMVFYSTSAVSKDNSVTGAEPNYTATYGQYDSGANIFTKYWNFAGTSTPTGWTLGSLWSVNNGLIYNNPSSASASSAYYGTTQGQNFVFDSQAITTTATANRFLIYPIMSAATSLSSWWGIGMHDTAGGSIVASSAVAGTETDSATALSVSTKYIFTSVFASSGSPSTWFYENYTQIATSTSALPSGYYIFMYGDANTITTTYYFIRTRTIPPSNTMPSSTFGSVVQLATHVSITDSGTGTDTVLTKLIVTISDSSIGTDAVSVKLEFSLSDSGVGLESISKTVYVVLSDSGQGVDTISLKVSFPLSDSGHGIETINRIIPILQAYLPNRTISVTVSNSK